MPSAAALVQEPLRLQRPAVSKPQSPGLSLRPGKELQSLRGGQQVDAALGDTAHMKSVEEVLKMAGVDAVTGLSADEVLSRREQFGLNQLPTKDKVPLWQRFVAQFDDKMVHILLAAAGISIFFSMIGLSSRSAWRAWRRLCCRRVSSVCRCTLCVTARARMLQKSLSRSHLGVIVP